MTYLDEIAQAIRDEVSPSDIPEGESDLALLFRLYALVALVKGTEATREDVHNAWVAWVTARGEFHESAVPFASLPSETQAEDEPYAAAIRTVADRYSN